MMVLTATSACHHAKQAQVYITWECKYSATSHIQAVWDQGVSVIVKVPVSMNPLLPMWTLRHSTL